MEKTMESVARDLEITCRRIMVLEAVLKAPENYCADYDNRRRWASELEILHKLKEMLELERALMANRLRRD
jgi:hypothetical protein